MKKTLLIALITGTIFSGVNAATNTIIKNDTNSTVEVTLENTGTKKQVNITVNAGQTSGTISSPEDSTLTFKTATGTTMTLPNPQAKLTRITPGGVAFEN